jgi:hypothetical protein
MVDNPPFLIEATTLVQEYYKLFSLAPLLIEYIRVSESHKSFVDKFLVICNKAKEYVRMKYSVESETFAKHLDNRLKAYYGPLTGVGRINAFHNTLIDTYKECVTQYQHRIRMYEITKREMEAMPK